jgi:hypothetical protein
MADYVEDNIIRIADKDIRTYLGQCDKKFNKYPSIVLSFGESFAEKGRTIVSILGAIGIKVHKSNTNAFGNIRFNKQEESVINQKTGKREPKTFYKILLAKIDGLSIEDINKYEFVDIEQSKNDGFEDELKNEIKISDKGLDFYLGQCNLDFQSYDQLVLSSTEDNIELIKYMVKILNPLGIEIYQEYRDLKSKKVFFKTISKERTNPRTGRKELKKFYRLGITKVQELFMYTNPKEAIEFLEEE